MDEYEHEGGAGVGALLGLGVGIFVVGSLVAALTVIGIGEIMGWGPDPAAASPAPPATSDPDADPDGLPDGIAEPPVEGMNSLQAMWSMWCANTPTETEDSVTRYSADAWTCNSRDGEELNIYQFTSVTNLSSALQALANRYGDPAASRLSDHPIICGPDYLIAAEREPTARGIEDDLRGHGVSMNRCSL